MSSVGTLSNYCSFPGVPQVGRPSPVPQPSFANKDCWRLGAVFWDGLQAWCSAQRASGAHTRAHLARYHPTNPAHITRQVTVSAHPGLPSGTCILCTLMASLPALYSWTHVYTHMHVHVYTHPQALLCVYTHVCTHTQRWTHIERHTNTCPTVIRSVAPAPRTGCSSVIYA